MERLSGVLGTKDVVTSKECWKLYLNSALAAGLFVAEELQGVLMSMVGQLAGSDTPWALCAACAGAVKQAGISPRMSLSELPAHGHALCRRPEPMVYMILDDEAMMSAQKAATTAVDEILTGAK